VDLRTRARCQALCRFGDGDRGTGGPSPGGHPDFSRPVGAGDTDRGMMIATDERGGGAAAAGRGPAACRRRDAGRRARRRVPAVDALARCVGLGSSVPRCGCARHGVAGLRPPRWWRARVAWLGPSGLMARSVGAGRAEREGVGLWGRMRCLELLCGLLAAELSSDGLMDRRGMFGRETNAQRRRGGGGGGVVAAASAGALSGGAEAARRAA